MLNLDKLETNFPLERPEVLNIARLYLDITDPQKNPQSVTAFFLHRGLTNAIGALLSQRGLMLAGKISETDYLKIAGIDRASFQELLGKTRKDFPMIEEELLQFTLLVNIHTAINLEKLQKEGMYTNAQFTKKLIQDLKGHTDQIRSFNLA
jgi:hypothetical protein